MVWREVRTCFLCTLFSFVAASASRLPYMLSGRILQPAARSLASFSLTRFASNTAPMSRPKVVVLSGATSVGKSGAAMELANVLNGEIIVADSVQVYKGLDVGANKPSLADQQQVRHHLIDIFETSEDVSAAEFCERAVEAVKDVVSRGRTPIFVGGSTMWLRWLVDGIPEAPPASPESIERAAELIGAFEQSGDWDSAIRVLQSYSAELASKTERNNWHRLHRYLQISLDLTASSKEVRLQDQRTPLLQDYDVRCFFLMEERNQLYHTIDSRCLQMLCHGLVGEVGRLLLEGKLLPDQIASRAIGYRQTIDYFCKRDIPSADVHEFLQYIREFGSATRSYARRQHNWYRKDKQFMFLKMEREANQGTQFVLRYQNLHEQHVLHRRQNQQAAQQTTTAAEAKEPEMQTEVSQSPRRQEKKSRRSKDSVSADSPEMKSIGQDSFDDKLSLGRPKPFPKSFSIRTLLELGVLAEHQIDSFRNVASEIQHWLSVPREEFVETIQDQMRNAELFTKWLNYDQRKSMPTVLESAAEQVISECVKRKIDPPPSPSGWSAQDLNARQVVDSYHNRMFTSSLDRLEWDALSDILQEADSLRTTLWATIPDTMNAFLQQKKE